MIDLDDVAGLGFEAVEFFKVEPRVLGTHRQRRQQLIARNNINFSDLIIIFS